MNSRAVRQRCDHQRSVMLRGGRHQVAQMVADDIIHLPMRQNARLRTPGRARCIEEPSRMVAIHIRRPIQPGLVSGERFPVRRTVPANGNLQPAGGIFRPRDGGVIRESGIEDVDGRTGGLRQVRHLGRRQAEVGRHPNSADHPRREHRFQHGVGVPRVQQHPVAMTHTLRRQGGGGTLDPIKEPGPVPGLVTPDDRRPVGKTAGGLDQHRRQVGGWNQRSGSRIET